VNWLLFAILAWLFAGLEQGLRDALVVGQTGIAPSFAFVLLTFVAMSAPRPIVMWAAVALGVFMDLLFEMPLREGMSSLTMIGPHAIAYALGCQLILSLRGIMIRRNPFTLGFLAASGAAITNLSLVAIFTLKNTLGAPFAWDPKHQLIAAVGSAVYTGVIAIALAFVLFPASGPLGLPNQQQRRFQTRR
jgi:hypothetical protein